MRPQDSLQLARIYIKKSMEGAGAVKGKDGKDGISPNITVTENPSEYQIRIQDVDSDDTITLPKNVGGNGSNNVIVEFDDLTPEQLESLKGDKGDAFTYEDFTETQLESLKGSVFTPLVSLDGELSWTNTGNLDNPEPVNIKGKDFKYEDFTEEQLNSLKGEKGDDGFPFLIYKEYNQISEFNPDDFPEVGLMFMCNTVDIDEESGESLGFPVYRYAGESHYSLICHLATEGIKGEKGEDGISPVFTIGSVTSGDKPSVTIGGTSSAPILNFVLEKGEKGDVGSTPEFKVGTVSSVDSSTTPSVTITGTPQNPILNFRLPKGETYNLTLSDKNAIAEIVSNLIDTAESEEY